MKEILNAFGTFVVFSGDCPYIKVGVDKEEISKLIEEVQELKKKIKIENTEKNTESEEIFLH
ncbi:hypothetical protein [Thermococcus sp.]